MEGEADGDVEGDVEGEADGDAEGEADGDVEGEADGDVEGEAEGEADGDFDADDEAEAEGAADGATEGAKDGTDPAPDGLRNEDADGPCRIAGVTWTTCPGRECPTGTEPAGPGADELEISGACDVESGSAAATAPDTGALSGRRRFISVSGGLPDGLTLDAEGCLWLAAWGTGELHRYTPDGQLDTIVKLPVSQVTSAAFGGPDLSTLYITTARENFTAADLRDQPHAGDIFACTPGVTGRPPYLFGA